MEFITVEQFQEQPGEVQKIFLDWWKCDYGDLYYYNENPLIKYKDFKIIDNDLEYEVYGDFDYFKKTGVIPIFTEGQLRKFIEDKTGCKLDATFFLWDGYTVEISKKYEEEGYCISQKAFEHLGEDLLQAYWKVACEIAEQLTVKN